MAQTGNAVALTNGAPTVIFDTVTDALDGPPCKIFSITVTGTVRVNVAGVHLPASFVTMVDETRTFGSTNQHTKAGNINTVTVTAQTVGCTASWTPLFN